MLLLLLLLLLLSPLLLLPLLLPPPPPPSEPGRFFAPQDVSTTISSQLIRTNTNRVRLQWQTKAGARHVQRAEFRSWESVWTRLGWEKRAWVFSAGNHHGIYRR